MVSTLWVKRPSWLVPLQRRIGHFSPLPFLAKPFSVALPWLPLLPGVFFRLPIVSQYPEVWLQVPYFSLSVKS